MFPTNTAPKLVMDGFLNRNEITNANATVGYGFIPNGVEERNLYYYHPDHLGSSSYITDKEGQVIQHTEYMAFGETFVDEHSVSKTMPYLFNGKELDFETGLYYYGVRYYDPKASIFLNVDPLTEKTGTPYAYTYNNPIRFIDPTGMEAECPDCPKPEYVDQIRKGSDGNSYAATAICEGCSNLEWLRQSDIQEVTVFGKAKNGYVNFDNSYDTGTTSGYYALSTGYNVNGVRSNLKMFSGEVTNTTGTGMLPLAFDLGANASVMSGNLSTQLGSDNWNIYQGATGDLWSANVNAAGGIFTGEGKRYGVLLDGNAGAYAAKGDYTFGITLGGVSLQGTIGGSFGSAHIGGTAGAYFDQKTGSFNLVVQENIGLGVGEKGAVKIKIPLPFIK